MTKAELLRILRAQRGEWEHLLALAPPARLEEPMTPGGNSVRDVAAHLLWYEQESLVLCRDGLVAQPELWTESEEARNSHIWHAAQTVPVHEVLDTIRAQFQEIVDWLAKIDDRQFHTPVAFPEHPAVPCWQHIWECSYDHYRVHMDEIRAWLDAGS